MQLQNNLIFYPRNQHLGLVIAWVETEQKCTVCSLLLSQISRLSSYQIPTAFSDQLRGMLLVHPCRPVN